MRILLAIFCWLCIALAAPTLADAKGWRGIVPLRSTRTDVERLLGRPTQRLSEYSVFYRTPNESAIITYSKGLPCGIGENYSQWRVPRNSVESILVTPLKALPLSELRLEEGKYQKRSGGHRPEDIYYINEEDGESIRVFQEEVMAISYYPGTKETHLACPGLSPAPKGCQGPATPVFDSYGDVRFEQEQWLLDNFTIVLTSDRNKTGHIIAYAGKRARVGEARQRAKRAKNYIVKLRRFAANRLRAIDGGYREEPEVQLYVVPRGGCTPIPSPTVDPRDVHFIRNSRLSQLALKLRHEPN